MPFLDAARRHPLVFPDGTEHTQMVHLPVAIDHPNWEVGPYTYANDFDPPDVAQGGWAARLAPYLYPGAPERLRIGPFCQIAHGVRFVTTSANHAMDGISTYPFAVFDPASLESYRAGFTGLPDTGIGPDCWIGHGALILPGARLGAGVIVGAGAVVRGDIPDYAIVAGNPARVIRLRFPPDEVATLLRIAWWTWTPDRIRAHLPLITGGDVAALARAAETG